MQLVSNSRTTTGAFEVLFVVMMMSISIGGTWAASRIWRNAQRYSNRVPVWWGGGPVSWRAYVRAGPALIGFLWLMTLVSVYTLLVVPLFGISNTAFLRVVFGLLGLGGAAILLSVSIALFNRPRSFVPPELKNDTGAFEEFWGRRKKRTARSKTHRRSRGN
jgi:hypothetical protein